MPQVASGATTQVDNLWIKLVDTMRWEEVWAFRFRVCYRNRGFAEGLGGLEIPHHFEFNFRVFGIFYGLENRCTEYQRFQDQPSEPGEVCQPNVSNCAPGQFGNKPTLPEPYRTEYGQSAAGEPMQGRPAMALTGPYGQPGGCQQPGYGQFDQNASAQTQCKDGPYTQTEGLSCGMKMAGAAAGGLALGAGVASAAEHARDVGRPAGEAAHGVEEFVESVF
ncbi:unnamed protein product [Symbiodinium pilosum]|uniref:Uncharacterized protein n=1 Tax=Symbiodinium pilosum TaxID=2952 RepID=A0A812YCI0_SYMPI|nr:unnamed protein product [Symbiodinium pilosum]